MVDQEPVCLSVSHLPASTSFYLSALQPLGYCFHRQVQSPSGSVSQAIGLGPEAGHRVDLYLAQADSEQLRTGIKKGHIVFPARSRSAVEAFYNSALNAGSGPVHAPHCRATGDGSFTASVTDFDGHKLEVCSSDDAPSNRGRETQVVLGSAAQRADDETYATLQKSRSPPTDTMSTRTTIYPQSALPAVTTRTPTSSRPSSSSQRQSPESPKQFDLSSKVAVGTLLGTATGAAIAYAVLHSHEDSRKREAEYRKRIQARANLEAEARSFKATQEIPMRVKTKHVLRTSADRDSGYYSTASQHDDLSRRRSASCAAAPRRMSNDHGAPTSPGHIARAATMPDSGYSRSSRASKSARSSSTAKPNRMSPPPYRKENEVKTSERRPNGRWESPPPSYRSWGSARRGEKEVYMPASGRTVFGEEADADTVLPEDSISNVGSPEPRRRRRMSSSPRKRDGNNGRRTVLVL